MTPIRSTALPALLLLLTFATGCDLLGDDAAGDERLVTARVIVGNGGNFGDQTGYLTLYDPTANETAAPASLRFDAFVTALALHENRLYVTLNTGFTTGRLDVVSLDALDRTTQYTGLGAARAVGFAEGRAYVPMADGSVAVLDLEAAAVVDTLQAAAYPEGVAAAAGKVFIASAGLGGAGRSLTVIDATAATVTGTLDVGCDGPDEVMVDDEGELVVVCTGKTVYDADWNVIEQTDGQIVFVDPTAERVVERIALDRQAGSANGSQGAHYAPAAEEAHVLAGEVVYRVDTDENRLVDTLEVPETAGYMGLTAVAYDPEAEHLYLGRFAEGAQGLPDYAARGAVLILDRGGEQVDLFQAGPSPAHIVLQQEVR